MADIGAHKSPTMIPHPRITIKVSRIMLIKCFEKIALTPKEEAQIKRYRKMIRESKNDIAHIESVVERCYLKIDTEKK
jgi:hypothetical protein